MSGYEIAVYVSIVAIVLLGVWLISWILDVIAQARDSEDDDGYSNEKNWGPQ
jgi:hypothetical protein